MKIINYFFIVLLLSSSFLSCEKDDPESAPIDDTVNVEDPDENKDPLTDPNDDDDDGTDPNPDDNSNDDDDDDDDDTNEPDPAVLTTREKVIGQWKITKYYTQNAKSIQTITGGIVFENKFSTNATSSNFDVTFNELDEINTTGKIQHTTIFVKDTGDNVTTNGVEDKNFFGDTWEVVNENLIKTSNKNSSVSSLYKIQTIESGKMILVYDLAQDNKPSQTFLGERVIIFNR